MSNNSLVLTILFLILLTLEVITLSFLDKKFYNTYLTPFNVLAIPYLLVIISSTIIGPLFNFVAVSYMLIAVLSIYLLIFWFFGSFLMIIIIGKKNNLNKSFLPIKNKYKLKKILVYTSWFILAAIFFKLMKTISWFGNFNIWKDAFTAYFIHGLAGHLTNLAILLLIYFYCIKNIHDIILSIIIFLIICVLFLYQVKTWIFIPLISILLFMYIENRIHFRSRYVAIMLSSAYLVFLLVYFPASGFNKNYFISGYTYFFIFKHFLYYLFAGVLSFSEHIRAGFKTGIDPDLIYAPFINLYNLLTGSHEIKQIVEKLFYSVDNTGSDRSNVQTFFGTLIIYLGHLRAIVYTAFFSFIMYLLLVVTYISKNIWILIMYLFLLSGLAVGWFNFYFNNLNFIEIPIYCMILAFLSLLKMPKKIDNLPSNER